MSWHTSNGWLFVFDVEFGWVISFGRRLIVDEPNVKEESLYLWSTNSKNNIMHENLQAEK